MSFEELEAAVLSLDLKGRARLAERLLKSLESLTEEENDRLWAEEAERRDRSLDNGTAKGRPAEEVFRDLRARS